MICSGSLRFAPPERMEGWHDDGILETRSQPNACQQTPDTAFGDFSGATQWNADTASTISEDCLYLSVHAPRNFTGVRGERENKDAGAFVKFNKNTLKNHMRDRTVDVVETIKVLVLNLTRA